MSLQANTVADAPKPAPAARASLAGLGRAELAEALAGLGVPPRERRMRATQLWHWIYHRGTTDFGAMTTIGKEMRAALAQSQFQPLTSQESGGN